LALARDGYAKVGEYSVAACAYALLGYRLFPEIADSPARTSNERPTLARSTDLGVVRIAAAEHELILRTTGEVTSWDRRYLAPTVLRFEAGDELLVGAIAKTVSTDHVGPARPTGRWAAIVAALKSWYVHGHEQLDAVAVGFVPVVRAGTADYLPYRVRRIAVTDNTVEIDYQMLRLRARGFAACAVELRERLRGRLKWLKRGEYRRPFLRLADSIECTRRVSLAGAECRIHDRILGSLRGKTVLFSTRGFAGADIRVAGLTKERALTGWGSDGRQAIEVYAGRTDGETLDYECVITRRRLAC
jgi:hypothetical protein